MKKITSLLPLISALILFFAATTSSMAQTQSVRAENPPQADVMDHEKHAVPDNSEASTAPNQTNANSSVTAPSSIVPIAANPDNMFDAKTDLEQHLKDQLLYLNPTINVNKIKSLFFTKWEHDLIADARLGLKTTASIGGADGQRIHELAMGGIVYHSDKKWSVWLNKTEMTPDALLPQVLNIKVFKDYVELEWFDSETNLIYPVRMRSHQRFNLDTRMFIPGDV